MHSKTNTTVVFKLHLRETSLTLLVQNISTHGQQYQTASATIQISVVVRLASQVGGWAIGFCPTPIKNISTETRHTFHTLFRIAVERIKRLAKYP